MTSQTIYLSRPVRPLLALALIALAAMLATGSAEAKRPSPTPRSTAPCADGSRPTIRLVRKNGVTKRVRVCRHKAPSATAPTVPTTSSPTVTDSAPSGVPTVTSPLVVPPVDTPVTVPPVVVPPTEPPEEEEEGEEESPVVSPPTGEEPEIHAEIGTGYQQNPLVPAEVTWHYSASATRTVVVGGKSKTEKVPLPKGELAFFVDGKLVCEIEAGGAIAKSACTVVLQRLGAHEVETIFSGEEGSGTVARTDYVNRYPTQTNLQASVEPTAPEYLDIGPNKYGYEQYGYEVGRLRISGSTTPAGYPTFDCEGFDSGCLEPEVSLKAHNGSVSVPLYAQNRPNPATGKEEWKVEFEATDRALRETGQFWQYPEESVGAQYFHVVSEPSPTYYEPSELTLPLNLNGGHYPFHRWMHLAGEAGPSVAAVEGVPQKVVTIGTYDKFDGPAEWMKIQSHFSNVTGETEGCVYTLAVDGTLTKERRTAKREGFEFINGWPGYAAGPHTFELYVEREAGAGPGPCKISQGTFEVWEIMH